MARKARPPIVLSATDAAYVAGLIDGEGTVTILCDGRTGYCSPMIVIQMTHHGVLDHLGALVGSTVTHRRSRGPKWADIFSLAVYGKRAQQLCEQMLPYMHVKRSHAELLCAFPYPILPGPGRPREGGQIDADTHGERERITREIRALNLKGPREEPH